MDDYIITVGQLRAAAEIQKAGIDASCYYSGTVSKIEARNLKDAIDFLVKTLTEYAISYNKKEMK